MKIVIRAVGKMRDRRMGDLCGDYLDRLRRHLPAEIEEVADDADLVRDIPAGADVVALDPAGREFSTDQLIGFISDRMVHGRKALLFLIGGAEGLSETTRAAAGTALSLSRLTLPHRLARVVLCEQIYRCVSAIRGEPYNK